MSKTEALTLTPLLPGVYVIQGTTNVGVITNTRSSKNTGPVTEIYLVDAGRTEEQGLAVLEAVNSFFKKTPLPFCIKAIINTHAHSDHCGADAVIQQKTGCKIFLSAFERGILENPYIQAGILWGGFPPKELQNSLYMPAMVQNSSLINFNKKLRFTAPDKTRFSVTFLELPGHYFGDTGVLISTDKTKLLFAGDAISNRRELGKYWIQFMIQPQKFIETLQKICDINNLEYCVPSHGKIITEDLAETAELCTIAIYSTRQSILNALKGGSLSTEQLIKEVARQHNINMGFGQYNLVSATIRSHLSSLRENKQIKMKVIENQVFWETI